jgi:Zn-dependent protease with chaperone function
MESIRHSLYAPLGVFIALIAMTTGLFAQSRVEPGFNLFSTEQEIEIGKEAAQQAERELPVLRDSTVSGYLEELGARLAREAPGAKYPYRFRVLDVADLNAFALPAGFIYVNRGLLEAVRNEDELAGVLAHEIGHVALRHSTNLISKQYLAQAGISVLGGVLGGESKAADILQVVGGAGLPLLFLKFSRAAEEQSDTVGAQMMARTGYDPLALASFFETLQSQSRGGPPEFLSSHPNYDSRRENIEREAGQLRRAEAAPIGELSRIQDRLSDMRPASRMADLVNDEDRRWPSSSRDRRDVEDGGDFDLDRIERPSSRFVRFSQRNGYYQMERPDNWSAHEARDGFGVTVAPASGIVDMGRGRQEIIAGVIVNHYTPFLDDEDDRSFESMGFRAESQEVDSEDSLREATRDLLVHILDGNPHLQPASDSLTRTELDHRQALRAVLTGTSPVTRETEHVTLLAREAGDGHVLYLLLVTPEQSRRELEDTFHRMVSSMEINDRAVHETTE